MRGGERGQVLVAILTWRGEELTRTCLESLRATSSRQAVLIVDNDSRTGEGSRLSSEFGVDVLEMAANQYVAGGYNGALVWAAERGFSHVLLLNNDTELLVPDTVERLLEVAEPDVAVVGPIVESSDGRVWGAGGRLSMWTGRAAQLRSPRSSSPYRVDWVDGSALLISVAAAQQIGGLSLDFHLYWEETDWCVRARRAGYKVLVQPSVSIRHMRGATITGLETRVSSLRSALLFLRRNASTSQLVVALLAYLFVRVPVYCVRVTRTFGLRACTSGLSRALGWNLRDAARRGIRLPADGPAVTKAAE